MKTITVQSGQSLWDIAVQYCGTTEAAFEIAALKGMMPTAQPRTGERLTVPNAENKKVVRYYEEHGLVPASA